MKSSMGGATGEATLASRSGGASAHLRLRSAHVRLRSAHVRAPEGAGETNAQKKGSGRRREGKRIWKAGRKKGSEPGRLRRGREKKRGIKRTETGTEMRGATGGGDK